MRALMKFGVFGVQEKLDTYRRRPDSVLVKLNTSQIKAEKYVTKEDPFF